jgi:hypothetical protein
VGSWLYEIRSKRFVLNATGDDYRLDEAFYVWIPSGDQLEKEIQRLCDNKQCSYDMHYYCEWSCQVKRMLTDTKIQTCHENPLVAKIQLLIKLLGSE